MACLRLWILMLAVVAAANGARGADVYLETQVKLQTPKKDSDRSREGGLEHASFRIWLPDGVSTIRGVVFNPFYTKAVTQEHWQAACRQWGFGILASNFFGVKQDEFPRTIDEALQQFATASGRAELLQAKFCPVGMSAGAGMSVKLAELMPDRVIAVGPVCLEVGPRTAESMKIPVMTIFGERDGRQYEKLMETLPAIRAEGARFGIAVQWRRKHEFGQANNLLLPLFDAAIRQRLDQPGKPLKDYEEAAGWLGDVSGWGESVATIAPFEMYQGDKARACWLPDEKTARAWQAFVTRQPALEIGRPAGLGDGQPFVLHKVGQEISVEVRTKSKQSFHGAVTVFAGDANLGELVGGRLNVQFDEPGIYPLYLRATLADGSVLLSRPNTIVVTK